MILSPDYRMICADLEEFYIHPIREESKYLYSEKLRKKELQHHKVVSLEKTKNSLENAFRKRKIPIRIFYGHPQVLSPLRKPGVITLFYQPLLGDEPPTSWMIIHNLAHGMFDDPFITNSKRTPGMLAYSESKKNFKEMRKFIEKFDLVEERSSPNQLTPTTRSYQNKAIGNPEEAFFEVFTQWVVKGKITFAPDTPDNQKKARLLERFFRLKIDRMAREGHVLHNIS